METNKRKKLETNKKKKLKTEKRKKLKTKNGKKLKTKKGKIDSRLLCFVQFGHVTGKYYAFNVTNEYRVYFCSLILTKKENKID